MASTPGKSGIYAGSMTVRGNNLRNSLGNVDISGLYNSTSDPSGVLTRQAQDEAIANQIMASIEAENAAAAEANTGGPKTDFPGINRDLTSDSIGGYAVDLGSVYSLFPDAVAGAVTAAMQNDYLNSILESQLTPEQLAAADLGLSVAEMNARTEDMLDSILKAQGETETGFVNESARLAAEGILKGKIAQAGVTDPAAQEAALKSAMESLEGGASGLDAVKAAASGAKDYVEDLLASAKEIVDKGYDKVAAALPKGVLPDTVGIDPTTGQTTAVWGKTSGTPVLGGTIGGVGGGTYAGVTTTGNAALDAVIKIVKEGGDVESVIGAVTGLPSDVVSAAVNTVKTVTEELDPTKLDNEDDGRTDIVLTPGAGTGTDPVDTLLGDGVETVTGTEIIDPNSTNQVLTVGDTTKGDDEVDVDDEVLGGGKWVNTGAGGFDEVVGPRIAVDGFDAGSGPDDEVVGDDKVLEEVVGPRIIGDPFTFKPILDEEKPPVSDEEVPPVLDEEVPPEPPPEVPEIPEAIQGYRGVQTKPGELVDIEYLYDIAGPSIFAPKMEEEEKYNPLGMYSPYAEGGIVQDYDIEELIRFLESQRG